MKNVIYVPGNLGDIAIFAAALNALCITPSGILFVADTHDSATFLSSLLLSIPGSCEFIGLSKFLSLPRSRSSPFVYISHPVVSFRSAIRFFLRFNVLITPYPAWKQAHYIVPRNLNSCLHYLPLALCKVLFSAFYTYAASLLHEIYLKSSVEIQLPSLSYSPYLHEYDFHALSISSFASSRVFSDSFQAAGVPGSLIPQIALSADSSFFKHLPSSYLLLSPFASKSYRQPSLSTIRAFLSVVNTDNLPVVLVGASNKSCSSLYSLIRDSPVPIFLDLVDKTSLAELIGLVQRAHIAIVSDSLILHLSVLSYTQTFLIGGGGHFSRFCNYANSTFLKDASHLTILNPSPDLVCLDCNWRCSKSFSCIQFDYSAGV